MYLCRHGKCVGVGEEGCRVGVHERGEDKEAWGRMRERVGGIKTERCKCVGMGDVEAKRRGEDVLACVGTSVQ